MWYLSRTPHSSPQHRRRTRTVFPISETGIFEDIAIVEIADEHIHHNKDITLQPPLHNDTQTHTAWEWFAYESSLTLFKAVVVPRNPSFNLQVITIIPTTGKFLCALMVPSPRPFAYLYLYSPRDNMWDTVSKMNCESRNPVATAGAIIDDFLYLAGGYQGNPSYVDPSGYLNSVERLNLTTGEWEMLPPMQKRRSSATGFSYDNKLYIVGGNKEAPYSAEIYNPISKLWKFVNTFVPMEPDGFTFGVLDGCLLLLTWTDMEWVGIWIQLGSSALENAEWTLIGLYPNQGKMERQRLRQYGARLVRVGEELWVVVGDSQFSTLDCQVDGTGIWPTFPGPDFSPGEGRLVVCTGQIYAFSLVSSFELGIELVWRQIPVYSF